VDVDLSGLTVTNGKYVLGSGGTGGAVDSVNGQTGVVVLDTGDISEVANKKYVTDAQLTVIGNTSGTNTGDQTIAGTTSQITATVAALTTTLSFPTNIFTSGSIYTGSGTSGWRSSSYAFVGSSGTSWNVGALDGFTTITANDSHARFAIMGSTPARAASGTHPLFAGIAIKPVNGNGTGAAAVTNTSTLYIEGAGAGATNNYAAWIDAGEVRIDGDIGDTTNRVNKIWTAALESTAMPTVGGTALLTSLTAPQFTTVELGHATDTTIARIAAGRASIESKEIATLDNALTFTNKRIQPRTASTTTASTLTPDVSSANIYYRTTQTETLTIGAPTGTPVIGETIVIYVDSAGAQTLTINATYKVFGSAFPATTTAGKTFMMTCQYTGSEWNTLWANKV
jgi:hypothetical protein